MFDVLDTTEKNFVAIRVGKGTSDGYQELYTLLEEKTDAYGQVNVYEEVPNWTFWTFLTHLNGILPDLRRGPNFNIDRYAAVGDSIWAELLFDLWDTIQPIWPVAPNTMRYFEMEEKDAALNWAKGGIVNQ
ncbi:STAS/SEC14 domain-containing protein [Haloarcula laminariae]|uniref:STAS/SEC14 domain-containing protein n=1 Tax=Haloarcula laminariae TaxID=2961577 RepID=UPI0021CA4A47|nr:STAS/SEC14 domain-containing protein [Halomicroarcula laminariae]